MVAKPLCALLIFGTLICWGADAADRSLDTDKKEGQQKIEENLNVVDEDIKDVFKKLAEDRSYLEKSNNKYLDEGNSTAYVTLLKITKTMKKYVDEAIDKEKNMNTFRCILKAENVAQTAVKTADENFKKCSSNALSKPLDLMQGMKAQLLIIWNTVADFYQELYDAIDLCSDKNCVTNLVQKGQARQGNLKKVLKTYKFSDLTTTYGEEMMGCVRSRQNNFENAVRTCENSMKFC